MIAIVIVEGVAIALLGLLVVGLLRSHADILAALHRLGADAADGGGSTPMPPPARRQGGRPALDLAGTGPAGEHVAFAVAGRPQPTLLAFLSTGCGSCEPFWHGLAEPVRVPGGGRVIVVAKDAAEESPALLARLAAPGSAHVLLSSAAWRAYDVPGAPYFVFVDGPSGRIVGEGTGRDWSQVLSLLGQAAADHAAAGRPAADHATAGSTPEARADPADAELAAAGIGPGHPSLYPPATAPPADREPAS